MRPETAPLVLSALFYVPMASCVSILPDTLQSIVKSVEKREL